MASASISMMPDVAADRQQAAPELHPLRAVRLRLETQHEPIVIMRLDCPVAKSEGLAARAQVEVE
ncbi:MAG TPA: hypothetical protein VHO91_11360, partial [Rhodopila sp.]|nr:hypothetical protein [Rhodopila sp.]